MSTILTHRQKQVYSCTHTHTYTQREECRKQLNLKHSKIKQNKPKHIRWFNDYHHKKMETVTRFQTLDEADCISQRTTNLGEDMNQIILPPDKGK